MIQRTTLAQSTDQHHPEAFAPSSIRIATCQASTRQLEQHIYYGTPASIASRLEGSSIGQDRRFFHLILEGSDQPRIYEFEHNYQTFYELRVASCDPHTTLFFKSEIERIMLESQALSCAGRLVQSLSSYQLLSFAPVGIQELASYYLEMLRGLNQERFYKLTFNLFC